MSDLDYFDRTPVLDIKPYQPGYRADDYKLSHWNMELYQKTGLPFAVALTTRKGIAANSFSILALLTLLTKIMLS